jgi:hypothetical protein
MLKKLPLILLIAFCSSMAQDKIKGSRNVKTEQYDLNSFNSIQAKGEFKIGILKGSKPMVEIKADDNLHDLIQTDVIDGVLYIKPIKEISRSKSQELKITFSDTLKSIFLSGEVEFETLQDLTVSDFVLETSEDARAYMTLNAHSFKLVQNDDAKSELNVTAKEVNYQLNQSSNIKALVNSPVFNVDIYEKASAKIEGDTQIFTIRADQSSKFDGEKLTSMKADLKAHGNAKVQINVTDSLDVRISGSSETEVYSDPSVNLIEFKDKAVIAKKEFSKGLFQ